ncbi:glycosyltransferase family 39 protein [Patescibacteria group bacterium]|nr:glycosyltransferase family 39 protein [Patescibacteria group bacterium]
MNKKSLVILILILVLAFFLRYYKITEVPPSLNWDETAIGYNAYSILRTGHDEWGKLLPIHFESYGEYKLPLQIYFSIPAIAIFGLNDFSVRITPVVYGTLTILLIFLLTRALFRNNLIALSAAFFLAVSPWHIQLTRASFESSFSVLWVLWGIWWLVKGFENKKWWVYAIIPLALAMYTYNSARVFVPLYLLALLLVYKAEIFKYKKILLISIVVFLIMLIPMVPYYLGGNGASRYKLVSITDDPGLVPRIDQQRNQSTLPPLVKRFLYNRVTYVSFYTIEHYFAHFAPAFLFISGAPHKQHSVQGLGELFYIQAPLILLGLYWLFKTKNRFRYLLISWLLISIIPVSVTNDSIPQALRTLIAAPVYQILSAIGLYQGYMFLRKRKAFLFGSAIALLLVFAWEFNHYLYQLFVIYPVSYSRDWQYGYKQVVSYIQDHQNQYDEIVFSRVYGEPYMFTLFYLQYDPAKYQNDPNLVRYEGNNWIWVLRFGKFYFPDLGDAGTTFEDIVKENQGKKILFIGKPGDFPSQLPVLYQVNFLNGNPDFQIVEVK